MDLGYILRRAVEISWRHKALWPFGLIVGFATASPRLLLAGMRLLQHAELDLPLPARQFLQNPPPVVWAIILMSVALILHLSFGLLSTQGHAALIGQVDEVENHGATILQQGWRVGKRYVWRAFLVHLTLTLPIAALAVAGSLPSIVGALLAQSLSGSAAISGFFSIANRTMAQACCASTMCISVLVAVPLNVLQQLAMRSCVLEDRGASGAIAHAWWMLKEFTAALAQLWLVLVLLTMGALVVLGIPVALVGALAVITSLLAATLSFTSWLVAGLLLVAGAWILASILLSSVLMVVSAAWTLAYREFRGLGVTGE